MVNKIFITGGTGYVGGRLALALASLPNTEVIVATRHIPEKRLDGLQYHLIASTQEEVLRAALKGVSTVIHLAALNEIDCVKYPQEAISVNIGDTLRWLEAASANHVGQFIYFSTIHVYGSPLAGLLDETSLTRPTHPYSITHRAAEDYVLAARQLNGMDGIVLRLSNSFGAPATPNVNRWTLLMNDLCRQAVENQHLVLHSDGSQLRDFIPLSDVTNAVKHFVQQGLSVSSDGLFNLSAGQSTRVYDMAKWITDRYAFLFGKKIDINRPEPTAHAPSLCIASQKLQSTGLTLQHNVTGAIDETLMFCHHHFIKGL